MGGYGRFVMDGRSNSWLSVWDHKQLSSTTGLTVYAILCGVSAVVIALTLLVFSLAGVRAARVFHEDLLGRLLRAPMSFYDTTPLGRILNRYHTHTALIRAVSHSVPYTPTPRLCAGDSSMVTPPCDGVAGGRSAGSARILTPLMRPSFRASTCGS